MLVRFRFKNYGPFRDEAVFDMRAVRAYKEHSHNLIVNFGKDSYLKVAAIYGANASGKTSFVGAYKRFLNIVKWSFSKNDKDRKTDSDKNSFLLSEYKPFLFDTSFANEDTEFEGVFIDGSTEYRYGFSYNGQRINHEWLYKKAIETNRSAKILERNSGEIVLGSTVKSCEKYLSDIDDDVLALSFFSSLKLRTHVFKDVFFSIAAFLPVSGNFVENPERLMKSYFEKDFSEEEKPQFLSFLNAVDIDIKNVEVKKSEHATAVYTFHAGNDGSLVKVPIEIESGGTKKAIAIYSLLRIAINSNLGIIIDELNNQLHPLLVKYIVDLFSCESSEAQLIYTTHDTTLLNNRFMRRDQIWFTEKDTTGASSLYSLADFKIRNDVSYEKEYLSGIFGAIPSFEDFSFEDREN